MVLFPACDESSRSIPYTGASHRSQNMDKPKKRSPKKQLARPLAAPKTRRLSTGLSTKSASRPKGPPAGDTVKQEDWRVKTLAQMRALIFEADAKMIEER